MAQFVTDSQQMATAARKVEEVNTQIQTLLRSLQAEVASTPAHFKGDTASTFTGLMKRYSDDSAGLQKALRGISEQLAEAAKSYAASDSNRAAALRSSGSGLNMT